MEALMSVVDSTTVDLTMQAMEISLRMVVDGTTCLLITVLGDGDGK
jgi:hypothetical protein